MLSGGRTFPPKITWYFLVVALTVLAVPGCRDDGSPVEPAGEAGLSPMAATTQSAASSTIPGSYIVVFKRDVADAPGLARQLALASGGTLRFTYTACKYCHLG